MVWEVIVLKIPSDPGSKYRLPRPTATWSFGDKVLEAGDRVKMKTLSAYAELVISPR